MKVNITFTDQEILYTKPIRIGKKELTKNIFSKVNLDNKKSIDIYTLAGFYESSLRDKKNGLLNFFSREDLNLENIQDLYHPEILFDIETCLLTLKPLPPLKKIKTNAFYDGKLFVENSCSKIKISPSIDALKELAIMLNNSAVLPKIRLDGNRQFELEQLILFLNLLNTNVIEAIEYIEEPFKNYYDLYSFQHFYKVKIAIDESLKYFVHHLDKIPVASPLILKPALFGIAKSYEIIKAASLFNHSVIISSTYQPSSSMFSLLYLADYSNSFHAKELFHGLDTLKFLPASYQDDQVLNALSLF